MSPTGGSAAGPQVKAGVIGALPPVGYLERWAGAPGGAPRGGAGGGACATWLNRAFKGELWERLKAKGLKAKQNPFPQMKFKLPGKEGLSPNYSRKLSGIISQAKGRV